MKGKTNAMRKLDQARIDYRMHEYETDDGLLDGVSVANKTNQPPERVYKTLVTIHNGGICVFVIPVEHELSLKKAAAAANVKKLDMLPAKDLLGKTGYVKGGCSPVGMKKQYPTFIDALAEKEATILVSGGKIGKQIEISPQDLAAVTDGVFIEELSSK